MDTHNGIRKNEQATTGSLDALVSALREFELDHMPDGYPCVMMKDISALLDIIDTVRIVAFIQGAKFWEERSSGGTMWQADQILTEEEARRKLKNKTLGVSLKH